MTHIDRLLNFEPVEEIYIPCRKVTFEELEQFFQGFQSSTSNDRDMADAVVCLVSMYRRFLQHFENNQ